LPRQRVAGPLSPAGRRYPAAFEKTSNIVKDKPVRKIRMWKPEWAGFWEKQRLRLLGGLLCLAGAVALGRIAVIAQALTPWQDFWVVFLFSLFLTWAAVATFVGRDHSAEAVSGENVEARLNDWLLKFRFANQKLGDSSSYRFAYRVTAPDGQVVIIARPTALDNYLRYRTDLTILDRHRRALNDLGENGRRRFMVEYMSECARARVHIVSARALPLTVRIERTLPITRHLNGDDLWGTLEAMQQDIVIALTHIDLCLERMKESSPNLQIVPKTVASTTAPDAETWTHSGPS
jgi:hypothetical protein